MKNSTLTILAVLFTSLSSAHAMTAGEIQNYIQDAIQAHKETAKRNISVYQTTITEGMNNAIRTNNPQSLHHALTDLENRLDAQLPLRMTIDSCAILIDSCAEVSTWLDEMHALSNQPRKNALLIRAKVNQAVSKTNSFTASFFD